MNKTYKLIRKAKRITKRHIYAGQYIPIFKDPRKLDEMITVARLVQKTDDASIIFDMDDSINNESTEEHYVGQKVFYMGNPCYITMIYTSAMSITGKIDGDNKTITLQKPYPTTLIDSNKASKYILCDVDPNTIWKWMWDKQNLSYFVKFSDYEDNKLNLMNRSQKEEFFYKNNHLLKAVEKPVEKKIVRLNPRNLYFVSERWKVEFLAEPFLGDLLPGTTVIIAPEDYELNKIEEFYTGEIINIEENKININLKKSLFGKEVKRKKLQILVSDKKRLFMTSKVSHKTVYPITYYDWYSHRNFRINESTIKKQNSL